MALVICDAGQIHLLTLMLKTALGVDEPFSLHLFKNNVTPTTSSVAGDFTEANFSGYSSVVLSRASWVTPTTVSTVAQTTYTGSSLTWTCSGSGNTIYGSYILDGSSHLVWAELFPDVKTLSNGDTLNYMPVFTLTTA